MNTEDLTGIKGNEDVSEGAHQTLRIQDTVQGGDVSHLSDYLRFFSVLSLDCFDTLIFRRVAEPVDVFFDLQNIDIFRSYGITAPLRVRAEKNARIRKTLMGLGGEVTLGDIYRTALPQADSETIDRMQTDELMLESQICYAFSGISKLIDSAADSGKKIIIVSDTYFSEKQLRFLLRATIPENIYRKNSRVICSSEYGRSKRNGLFVDVIADLGYPPEKILHVGDNFDADCAPARALGIRAVHFTQADQELHNLQKMGTMALSMADSEVRSVRSATDIFRGVFASAKPKDRSPGVRLGRNVLGPLMYGFARYISNTVDKIRTDTGRKVIPVFMMRDGWLPLQAVKVLLPDIQAAEVYISRFTAWGASFNSAEKIRDYLSENISTEQYRRMAKQLMIPEEIAQKICLKAEASKDSRGAFSAAVFSQSVLDVILRMSEKIRTGLIKHLTVASGCVRGDILLCIDLGYSGTAQRLLTPILAGDLGVDLYGCYLLQLPLPGSQDKRNGLLDVSSCDHRTLSMLVEYIAVFEKLCTKSCGSVEGYTESGVPRLGKNLISEKQSANLSGIQNAALTFVSEAAEFFSSAGWQPDVQAMRDTVLGGLIRMLYLPEKFELEAIQQFEFDLNVGTEDTFRVFDLKLAGAGLRKRGITYADFEVKSDIFRTNTPAELRSTDASLALAFMVRHRFLMRIPDDAISYHSLSVPIILMRGQETSRSDIKAKPTWDGYYSLEFPVGDGSFQAGILFGMCCKWFQLDTIEIISSCAYKTPAEEAFSQTCPGLLHFGPRIVRHDEKLYECTSADAFALLVPRGITQQSAGTAVARIVFRPLVYRGDHET